MPVSPSSGAQLCFCEPKDRRPLPGFKFQLARPSDQTSGAKQVSAAPACARQEIESIELLMASFDF
jgi:hypothetical protein